MPKEREELFVPKLEAIDGMITRLVESNPTPEAVDDPTVTKAERKARLAQVLARGVVNDMLTVDLPKDRWGEWVRADAMQVRAMQSMGYWIDNEHANKRTIHGDGTSGNRVGDVVFMCTTRENYEIIQEIKLENARNNEYKGLRAEVEFQNQTKRDTGGDIPTFVDSQVKEGNIKVLPKPK